MRRCIDQGLADAEPPQIRLYKQAVELAAHDRRKAGNLAIDLGDDHLPIRDLRRRQMNRVGICEQLVAIIVELEGRSSLKILQPTMLFGKC